MIVLAIDTALEACSVAVLDGDRTRARRVEPMQRGHQERLAPLVAEAMTEADLPFAALDRVAVTVGPGSFTGLRVGLAFAKSLALALDLPCVGVGALEALVASRADLGHALRAAAVLDARRGNVYLQAFERGAPTTAPAILSIAAAQAALAGRGFTAADPLVGTGSALLREALAEGVAVVDEIDPAAVARLAAGRPAPDGRPAPLYLRPPDAKTIAERAAALRDGPVPAP